MEYISRHIESYLKKADTNFKALLVTGARQIGKSTMLRHLYPDLPYITFDDPVVLEQADRNQGCFFGTILIL